MARLIKMIPLLILLCPLAFSYTLSGTVTDDCDSVVIEGVTVTLELVNSDITDSSGAYSISGASNGSATINWNKDGYKGGTDLVTIAGDTEQNITIKKGYCATYGAEDVSVSIIDAFVILIISFSVFAVVIAIIFIIKFIGNIYYK